MSTPTAEEVAARVAPLLGDPDAVGPTAASVGVLQTPLPIHSPTTGEVERWFAPVTAGVRILGFFVVGLDLVVHRWSTFQRREGDVESCPLAADWLDVEVIRARAEAFARAEVGEPRLSYDRVPDRIAWILGSAGGSVFSAGDASWVVSA